MTTAIDTNVLIALWDRDPSISSAAQKGLETAFRRGGLAIAALRQKQRDSGTRRILADFMIGAHAEARGYRLLTLDE